MIPISIYRFTQVKRIFGSVWGEKVSLLAREDSCPSKEFCMTGWLASCRWRWTWFRRILFRQHRGQVVCLPLPYFDEGEVFAWLLCQLINAQALVLYEQCWWRIWRSTNLKWENGKISDKTDLFYWSEKGRWMSGCPATYSWTTDNWPTQPSWTTRQPNRVSSEQKPVFQPHDNWRITGGG